MDSDIQGAAKEGGLLNDQLDMDLVQNITVLEDRYKIKVEYIPIYIRRALNMLTWKHTFQMQQELDVLEAIHFLRTRWRRGASTAFMSNQAHT